MHPDNDPLKSFVEGILTCTMVALFVAVLWAICA
jgi:hypothetical protein